MPSEYTFRVSAWWTSSRTGLAQCESAPNTIHFSEAAELGGLQGRWTPEQLLLCALAGCFTVTFYDVAREAQFVFTDLEVEVEAILRRKRGDCSLDEILIRPTLTVVSEDQRDAGIALLGTTKAQCVVSRAVTVPQTLEPCVETVKVPVAGFVDDGAALKIGV